MLGGSFFIAGTYLFICSIIYCKMKKRRSINFDFLRSCIYIVISLISLKIFLNVVTSIFNNYKEGIYPNLCVHQQQISSTSLILFFITKNLEFCDTFLHLLQKKHVSFLHLFHHATVLPFSMYVYLDKTSLDIWFILMNTLVHIFMYYYKFRKIYTIVNKTTVRILVLSQLFMGIILCTIVRGYHYTLIKCDNDNQTIVWGMLLYSAYLILYLQHIFSHKHGDINHVK
jgi:hypothetical protein